MISFGGFLGLAHSHSGFRCNRWQKEAFGTSSVAGVEPIALLRCRFAKLADDYSVELLRRFAAVREEKALTALSSD